MKVEEIQRIRAKSDGTTLWAHTQAVLQTGRELLQSLSLPAEHRQFVETYFPQAAVLHDLGKVHPLFQQMLDGPVTERIRHEMISLWLGATYLEVHPAVFFAVATHHKNACDDTPDRRSIDFNYFREERWEVLKELSCGVLCRETLEAWLSLFPVPFAWKPQPADFLTTVSCRLLRKRTQKKQLTDPDEKRKFSLLRAFLQAADHLASGGIQTLPCYRLLSAADFQPRNGTTVYPFRHFQQVLQGWQGDAVLHAPTGSGKTEAALSWVTANQTPRTKLFYLLPYTASIHAMYRRLCSVFPPEAITVLHSKSLSFIFDELCREGDGSGIGGIGSPSSPSSPSSIGTSIESCTDYSAIERKARSLRALAREVYYPVKVTTLHQILSTPLQGRGWEFSLLDFPHALFIVDEFHAYNALLTGMMLGTVYSFKKLFQARFLFLSATIPHFILREIIDRIYDGDTGRIIRPDARFESDAAVMNRKRHRLVCHPNESLDHRLADIEADLQQGRSVLVVVNNVSTCQYLYERIHWDESKKRMLHGGFHARSRQAIERDLTHPDKEKRPQLLVATQAVEVSLDIDYDTAYLENAPVDSLIQRLGRVNRAGKLRDANGMPQMAPVHLFEQIRGKTPFYSEQILQDTWHYLSLHHCQDLSEDDLIHICNQVYRDGYSKEQAVDFELGFRITSTFEQRWMPGIGEQWVKEIVENSSMKVDVLCANLKEEYDSLVAQKRYIEANELLVSVYPSSKRKWNREDDVFVDNTLFYDERKGCIRWQEGSGHSQDDSLNDSQDDSLDDSPGVSLNNFPGDSLDDSMGCEII